MPLWLIQGLYTSRVSWCIYPAFTFVSSVSFHIGAFCSDARQFGAFHFGDFHFDAVPVRRVSLWRASTLARFSLARFHFGAFLFGAFPDIVRTYDDPVSANASFARTVSFLRRNAFYASLARISFCVAYLFVALDRLIALDKVLVSWDTSLLYRICGITNRLKSSSFRGDGGMSNFQKKIS